MGLVGVGWGWTWGSERSLPTSTESCVILPSPQTCPSVCEQGVPNGRTDGWTNPWSQEPKAEEEAEQNPFAKAGEEACLLHASDAGVIPADVQSLNCFSSSPPRAQPRSELPHHQHCKPFSSLPCQF